MLAYHFSLLFIFFVPLFLQSVARRQSSATFMWLLSVSAVMSLSFLPSISPSQFVTPNINFKKKKKFIQLTGKVEGKTGAKDEISPIQSRKFLKAKNNQDYSEFIISVSANDTRVDVISRVLSLHHCRWWWWRSLAETWGKGRFVKMN